MLSKRFENREREQIPATNFSAAPGEGQRGCEASPFPDPQIGEDRRGSPEVLSIMYKIDEM
jgi:hypothetical protein